jgi:hypothetical protein
MYCKSTANLPQIYLTFMESPWQVYVGYAKIYQRINGVFMKNQP